MQCVAGTPVKAGYNLTALPWQAPALIHAAFVTNQPTSVFCEVAGVSITFA